jgi:hypothetical protein
MGEKAAKEIQVMHIPARMAKENVIVPIIAKVAFLVFTITMAMMLIVYDNTIGYIMYGKEVIEFIVFVAYIIRRNNRR